MRHALALAARGLGRTWPNPSVGCVLVRDGIVLARGNTQPGGRPHAEVVALARAGSAVAGATAYVTLEPCAHHGKTPPCADALVAAGIGRCVVALQDPDPRVDGGGIRRLRDAGIPVTTGVCEAEAAALNAGFLMRVRQGRPLVTLKLATTLDGRIATHGGESRWITGPAARARGHLMRADHDAILVGIGTALADDPDLTCRLAGLEDRSPVRIVLDGRLRLPLTSRLVRTATETPTWIVTLAAGDPLRRQAYEQAGVTVIAVPRDADGRPDLKAAMAALGDRGLTRVLAEGGAAVAAALVRAGLVDRLVWMRAPKLIGADGIAALQAFGVDRLAQAPLWLRTAQEPCGDDLVETYERRDA